MSQIPEYNLKERVRKFDMSKLSPEDADVLSAQIGQKISELLNRSIEEANNFLKIYGLKAKMYFDLEMIENKSEGK